jgi:hypothetical protein
MRPSEEVKKKEFSKFQKRKMNEGEKLIRRNVVMQKNID